MCKDRKVFQSSVLYTYETAPNVQRNIFIGQSQKLIFPTKEKVRIVGINVANESGDCIDGNCNSLNVINYRFTFIALDNNSNNSRMPSLKKQGSDSLNPTVFTAITNQYICVTNDNAGTCFEHLQFDCFGIDTSTMEFGLSAANSTGANNAFIVTFYYYELE